MNIFIRTFTCVALTAAVFSVLAQDEEESSAETETKGEAVQEKPAKPASAVDEKLFTVLPFCKRVEGRGEVRLPDSDQWAKIVEGRFFPLGSSFRTDSDDSRMEIGFGAEVEVVISGRGSFGTRQQGLEVKSRTITLDSGTIEVRLPLNFPEGMFCVTNVGFCIENPAGVSRYVYRQTGDGSMTTVRCVSGELSVRGRHFVIPSMRAANELDIRTSQDVLFTGLFGRSGDYICKLDNGTAQEVDVETREASVVKKSIDWKLSPKTAVRIFRKVPEVGKNLAVSVMTFDSNGELRNRCSFTEDRYEVNTGDQGPAVDEDREHAAKVLKAAAESAETTTEEAPESETKSGQE